MAVQNHTDGVGRISQLFMLRLWLEELGNEQYELRGSIQHVNSGELLYFRDWPKMETFTERLVHKNGPAKHKNGEEPIIKPA
jgi:hypothetical protein